MSTVTTKCATAASIFTLLSLPGDITPAEKPVFHPDFNTAIGYIRRDINSAPVHAVDWDGKPGVETVLRENGRHSRGFWRELRAWIATNPHANLETHGTRVCELLLRHFGPYDKATSEVLARRRELEQKRAQVAQSLDTAFPPTLRSAAREYLGGSISYTLAASAISPLAFDLPLFSHFDIKTNVVQRLDDATIPGFVLSRSEIVLREHLAGSSENSWPQTNSLEAVAKEIVDRARPFLTTLDEIDLALLSARLPPIPGEGSPSDLDLISYGHLICRHRAVIAAIPLALAGFDIELVSGTREVKGIPVAHLFVYSKELGVLEASSDGPDFWIKVKSSSGDPALPVLTMEDGSIYRFYHRTNLEGK